MTRVGPYDIDTTRVLGKGAFSRVFGGRFSDKQDIALKVDTSCLTSGVKQKPLLFFEVDVLKELHDDGRIPGVPLIYWCGKIPTSNWIQAPPDKQEQASHFPALVMDRMKCSLSEWLRHMRHERRRITRHRAASLTVDLLTIIEGIHRRGYVHRDIKPENIMIGPDDKLYIIDFGLAKKYCWDEGEHIEYTDRKSSTVGTLRYCSTYTHESVESARRDDLQSIMFVFLMIYFDCVPWQSTPERRVREDELCQLKQEFLNGSSQNKKYDKWLRQFPLAFFEITRYILNLDFSETPNYDFLRTQLLAVFPDEG